MITRASRLRYRFGVLCVFAPTLLAIAIFVWQRAACETCEKELAEKIVGQRSSSAICEKEFAEKIRAMGGVFICRPRVPEDTYVSMTRSQRQTPACSPRIVILDVSDTKFTDELLLSVTNRTRDFTDLILSNTEITDVGLSHIHGLSALEYLDLSGTQITDAGIDSIEMLPRVQRLFLSQTRLTDAGLHRLVALKDLCELNIIGTQVTMSALIRFLRRRPDVRVCSNFSYLGSVADLEKLEARNRIKAEAGRSAASDGAKIPQTNVMLNEAK